MRTAHLIGHALPACLSGTLALMATISAADAAGGVRNQRAPKLAPAVSTPATSNTPITNTKMAPEMPATAEPTPQSQAWSPSEIADAKARCEVILKRIEAVAISQAPLREGACGTPAPIQLISVGKNPQVTISPPATMTCDLAEGLYMWLKTDLQPLAKRHFNADIIRIETMSDYSCRMAYGRAGGKLSEHGHANALDIRGFVTSSAKTAYVLENWGRPQREIRDEMIAAKAAADRAEAQRIAAQRAADAAKFAARSPIKTNPSAPVAAAVGAAAAGIAKSTIVDGTPNLVNLVPMFRAARDRDIAPALSLAPDKLGGPKVQKISSPADNKMSETANKAEFLHAAHDAACRIFGTTLGPEANSEHRNHFHVDMAARKTTRICD